MPLLNYTTGVKAEKTVAEITALLVKAGANRIVNEYANGRICSLIFQMESEAYQIPCRVYPVHMAIKDDTGVRKEHRSFEHAERVAWRIMKDWLEVQLALVEAGMVEFPEIMLPYLLVAPDKTMWSLYKVDFEQRASRLLTDSKKP